MDTYERAVHEAGHLTVAHRLGWWARAGTVGVSGLWGALAVTVAPSIPREDLDRDDPRAVFVLQPLAIRGHLEQRAMILMAGLRAQLLLRSQTATPAAWLTAAVTEPSPDDFALSDDDEADSDEAAIGRIVRMAHPHPLDIESRAAWRLFMECQTMSLVVRERHTIMRVAARLEQAGTLDDAALRALLDGEPGQPGAA